MTKTEKQLKQNKRSVTNSCLAIGIILIVVIAALLAAFQKSVRAEGFEHVVIAIKPSPQDIDPSLVKSKAGTTVIWINNSHGPVTIKFITKIGLACKVAVKFTSDLLGHYETGLIPQGGTASLCLISQGEFHYEVRRLKGEGTVKEEILRGKIIME